MFSSFMKHITTFILFDDNPSINALNKMIIAKVIKGAEVITFNEPEKGLKFIESFKRKKVNRKTVIFLDINMPNMNAWEFLKNLEKIDGKVKHLFYIYILSAYIKFEDKKLIENAIQKGIISGYFNKPLTSEIIMNTTLNKG